MVEEEGVPERHLHRFGKRQWPYNQEIARMAGEVSSRESIKFLVLMPEGPRDQNPFFRVALALLRT